MVKLDNVTEGVLDVINDNKFLSLIHILEISKYYMHGVSHHLGIDVHDVTVDSNSRLRPGAIISDEPGLYIDCLLYTSRCV